MSAGKCQTCGNEYKNLGAHRCKAPKAIPGVIIVESAILETPIIETIQASEMIPETSLVQDEPTHNEKQQEEPIIQSHPPTPTKLPWYKRLFAKKTKPEKKKVDISVMFDNLPKWSIKARKPWGSPKNKNATWIQIVAFSRTRPPKAVWCEYDGVSVSIDDMFFPAPHEIRGDIFPYDMDKGVPLMENSDRYNDMSYWNKLVERVKNMYFTLGLISGSGDFTKNIGLILLLVGLCILAVVINIIITYSLSKDFALAASNIANSTYAVNNYIATHP